MEVFFDALFWYKEIIRYSIDDVYGCVYIEIELEGPENWLWEIIFEMNTIGIMQPYFYPYLGYWQLINAVDIFVVLDDVNYIKRGYINSNSILVNGKPHKFSISIEGASQNKKINETKLYFPMKEREALLRTICYSYKKAPMFEIFYPLVEKTVLYDTDDLTEYVVNSIITICNYLEIQTKVLISSKIKKSSELKGEERIIEINKILNADRYINPIGGQHLYDFKHFSLEGIKLFFIQTQAISYQQFNNSFVPNLSLIDVLMFNDIEGAHKLLNEYRLIGE